MAGFPSWVPAWEAIRFSRRQDAENALDILKRNMGNSADGCAVTEHIWTD